MRENIEPRDKNGERHGYWEIYFPNGQLAYKGCYIHGKKHGYYNEYYKNGNLCCKGLYIHGKGLKYFKLCQEYGEIMVESYFLKNECTIDVYLTSKDKIIL